MKKSAYIFLLLIAAMTFLWSCDDEESYSDKLKKERKAISQYIVDKKIKVLSEDEFSAAGNVTDVSKNEYVLFNSSGVYMQIINQGTGEMLKNGESATILCRFDETNIYTDSLILTNTIPYFASTPEKMTVTRAKAKYYGSFDTSSSLMYNYYSSASVPGGWLIPMAYIKIGRQTTATDSIAHVKLIVPHAQGQAYASQYVYPCFYDITYQRGK